MCSSGHGATQCEQEASLPGFCIHWLWSDFRKVGQEAPVHEPSILAVLLRPRLWALGTWGQPAERPTLTRSLCGDLRVHWDSSPHIPGLFSGEGTQSASLNLPKRNPQLDGGQFTTTVSAPILRPHARGPGWLAGCAQGVLGRCPHQSPRRPCSQQRRFPDQLGEENGVQGCAVGVGVRAPRGAQHFRARTHPTIPPFQRAAFGAKQCCPS